MHGVRTGGTARGRVRAATTTCPRGGNGRTAGVGASGVSPFSNSSTQVSRTCERAAAGKPADGAVGPAPTRWRACACACTALATADNATDTAAVSAAGAGTSITTSFLTRTDAVGDDAASSSADNTGHAQRVADVGTGSLIAGRGTQSGALCVASHPFRSRCQRAAATTSAGLQLVHPRQQFEARGARSTAAHGIKGTAATTT